MAICPVCNRSLIRLASHLRKVHNLFYNTIQPSTLSEFIQLLKLFPLDAEDWMYLRKHRKELERYQKSGELLPNKVFQVLYNTFDKYRSKPGPKLVVLNGLFPALSSVKGTTLQGKSPMDQSLDRRAPLDNSVDNCANRSVDFNNEL